MTMLGLAVALADAFAPMIMEFPHAIQMMSRAALLAFPKQQVIENRCEHMHRNGENACFLKSPEHR